MEESVNKPRGFVVTETQTGNLKTRMFVIDDDFDILDGDGDLHSVGAGSWVLVVDRPFEDAPHVEKLLDTAERYFHGLWGHRPHHEPTRTAFDIRTAAGGRRPEADIPF